MLQKILTVIIIFSFLCSSCNRDFSVCPQNSSYRPATSLEKKMSGSANSFGFKIFQEIAETDAVLYLINALYFKGDWTYQFDPDNTFESDFTCADRSTVTCEMMSQKITAEFSTTESFKAIDLPYGDGHFSMTIILPDQDIRLEDIIAQFTAENWLVWMESFSEQEVDLQMPKFEISYDKELKDVLTALGMGIAFSGSADFSKITENLDIFISRVIHKTFIQVDEVGTEAAAVTAVEFRETAVGNTMILNRPFIYVIRDHVADNLLFMGILSNLDE